MAGVFVWRPWWPSWRGTMPSDWPRTRWIPRSSNSSRSRWSPIRTTKTLKKQVEQWDLELRRAYFGQRRFAAGGAPGCSWAAWRYCWSRSAPPRRCGASCPRPSSSRSSRIRETPRNCGGPLGRRRPARRSRGHGDRPEHGHRSALTRSRRRPPPSLARHRSTRRGRPPPRSLPRTRRSRPRKRSPRTGRVSAGPAGWASRPTTTCPPPGTRRRTRESSGRRRCPLEGNSSPIVWSDRIFLTGADQQRPVARRSTASTRPAASSSGSKDMPAHSAEHGATAAEGERGQPAMPARPRPPTAAASLPSSPAATWRPSISRQAGLEQEPRHPEEPLRPRHVA